jgi:hypothetical protein
MASKFTGSSSPPILKSNPNVSTSSRPSRKDGYKSFRRLLGPTTKVVRPTTWPKTPRSQITDTQLPWDHFTASTISLHWSNYRSHVKSRKSIVDAKLVNKIRLSRISAWAKKLLSIKPDRHYSIDFPTDVEDAYISTALHSHNSGEDDEPEHIHHGLDEWNSLTKSTQDLSAGENSLTIVDGVEPAFTSPVTPETSLHDATVSSTQPSERDNVDELYA